MQGNFLGFLKIGCAVIFFCQSLMAEDPKPFALEVQKDCVKIINGNIAVRTEKGSVRTFFTGPYGNFASEGVREPLAEIKVHSDAPELKKVTLFSQGTGAVFVVDITAKIDSAAIAVVITKKNISETPIRRYFYYRLAGLKLPYYYDKSGWQSAARPELPLTDWMFLPSANTNGGYGLMPITKEIPLTTLWPRKDWQQVGLYFVPVGAYMLKNGETASVGFKIFPATSVWEVITQFQCERDE